MTAAAAATSQLINLITTTNPNYSREDQRRMRYLQRKYAQAYGAEGGEDAESCIAKIGKQCKDYSVALIIGKGKALYTQVPLPY